MSRAVKTCMEHIMRGETIQGLGFVRRQCALKQHPVRVKLAVLIRKGLPKPREFPHPFQALVVPSCRSSNEWRMHYSRVRIVYHASFARQLIRSRIAISDDTKRSSSPFRNPATVV